MAHQRARSADERNRQPGNSPNSATRANGVTSPDSGFAEWSESSDHLSPIDTRLLRKWERPRPYERSVASDPSDIPRQRQRPQVQITSASDTFLPGLNLPFKNKLQKKRSFLPSLFTGSSNSLLPPSPLDTSRAGSGHRRGRRHSDTDIHLSIDLGSPDGRSAPPLVQAAQSGTGIGIEELLDQRADIEAKHARTGRTALAIASHCGNDDVVAILLRHGANPNTVDASGMTPLHLAATRGHYRVVDYLLKEDVNVNAFGPEKKTALRLAADNGYVEVVELLLKHRAKVNARDARNITPLHSAASIGDEDILSILLAYRADIEAKDGNFQAAIHHAAEKGHDHIVDMLLSKKADIEAVGKESMSPLTAACAAGSTDVVRLLIQKKASLKHKGDGAMTALHWASYSGHSEVVELLLEKRIAIDSRTNDGRTALHLAAMADKFGTAELLLRKGAHVDVTCENGLRPLHYAAQCANPDLIQLLLGHGASIEAETKAGKRPLHYAVLTGNTAMIELLLQRGAALDARDGAGDRPLCVASAEGHVEAVRLLLNRGSQMRSRYSKGPSHEDSPLCIAAKNGHLPIVEEFVRRGASVRERDEANWQPLRYAAFFAHPEIVQYLLSCGASISSLDTPGSFGFNLTASRIGFAKNADIDEYRRQAVLMLLQDAEVREQEAPSLTMQPYPSVQSPRQEFPAEKGNDSDGSDTDVYVPQAIPERQELPVFQKSPKREVPPPYQGSSTGRESDNERRAASSGTSTTLPTPQQESTSSMATEAARLTLDPRSNSQPRWTPVVPPVPSISSPAAFNRFVSPVVSSLQHSSSPAVSERIVSPLPSALQQPTGVATTRTYTQQTPVIPQSPARPPPPPPTISPAVRINSFEEGDDSLYSPPPPSRSPPLPPIPDPNDAIVVCDDCSLLGRTSTTLSCAGCRTALFMYHHIMSGDSTPIATTDFRSPPVRTAIYELA